MYVEEDDCELWGEGGGFWGCYFWGEGEEGYCGEERGELGELVGGQGGGWRQAGGRGQRGGAEETQPAVL